MFIPWIQYTVGSSHQITSLSPTRVCYELAFSAICSNSSYTLKKAALVTCSYASMRFVEKRSSKGMSANTRRRSLSTTSEPKPNFRSFNVARYCSPSSLFSPSHFCAGRWCQPLAVWGQLGSGILPIKGSEIFQAHELKSWSLIHLGVSHLRRFHWRWFLFTGWVSNLEHNLVRWEP